MSITFEMYGLANAMLAEIEAAFAAGGTCEFRSGSPPNNPADADSGTLLCSFALDVPAFDPPALGVMALAGAPKSGTAVATDVLGHIRFKDSLGNAQVDVAVGPAVPVLDSDDVSQELETVAAHGLFQNQRVVLNQGSSSWGPFFADVIDSTHVKLAASVGGTYYPVPPPGTYTAAYIRDASFPASVNSVSGTITAGDTVTLPTFEITI
jgi:hypothetical protein